MSARYPYSLPLRTRSEEMIGGMFSEVLLVLSAPDTDGLDFFIRNDQTRKIIISVQFVLKTVAVIVDVFFHIANLHIRFEIDSTERL